MQTKSLRKRISDYMNRGALEIAGWNVSESGALRKGCWDGVDTLQEALEQTNVQIGRIADVKPTDRLLDAGCGLGSTCIYFSREFGCKAVGVTIEERECSTARVAAKEAALQDQVQFEVMDFTDMDFEDESFDVILAIESVTWLDDKRDFLREAYRLLKPGGRLIVADHFHMKDNPGRLEKRILDQWGRGYSGFKLTTIERFKAAMADVGFGSIGIEDWTQKILPSSRILARHGFIWGVPDFLLGKIFRFKGSRRRRFTFASARAEFLALRFGAGGYYVVAARRAS